MVEPFDTSQLERILSALEPWKCTAFMVRCCERMVPNYEAFSAETGFGDTEVLKESLNSAWMWIETGLVLSNVQELKRRCDQQTPQTEDHKSPYTSAALDAANAAYLVLDSLTGPEVSQAVEVATLARDTVDLYIQERFGLDPNSPDLETTILMHPLMQAELSRQRRDLDDLGSSIDRKAFAIQPRAASDRISSLGL